MRQSNKPVSPLRQRMIEDMMLRKLNPKTQTQYIRAVVRLARFLGHSPDCATDEDLRRFQLHLAESGVSNITINTTLTGLKFFLPTHSIVPSCLSESSGSINHARYLKCSAYKR